MALALLINMCFVPFELSNEPFIVANIYYLYFNIFIEILFIVDIIFNFFTSYTNKMGIESFDIKDIALTYLSG